MVRGKEVAGVGIDVGFVCRTWPSGVASGLAAALLERGHRVHVLCLDGEGVGEPYATRDSDDEDDGVAVRRMAPGERDPAALVDERANDVVLAWLAETPCDVVHVHDVDGFGPGVLRAIRDVGQPLVTTLPAPADGSREAEELFALAHRRLASSEADAATLEAEYVAVVREVTGSAPALAGDEPAPPADADPPRKRGLLGRLFGR